MVFSPKDHTFVICAYKENPYLEQTIVSILGQTTLGSVIVSTSTPNSHIRELVDKYALSLTVNPNPHLAGDDWNWGYDHAETSLVTLAHQDDVYEPTFLAATLAALNGQKKPSETSLVFTDYYEIRDDVVVRDNSILRVKRILNFPFRSARAGFSRLMKRRVLAFGCSICCPSVTYNKELLGQSIFDTHYVNSCDYKTWVDLASRDGRFLYIPQQLIGHRIYAESATSKNLSENIRSREDEEILSALWPPFIAKFVNAFYTWSENSNELR